MPAAHLIQMDIAWEDRAKNFARARALLAAAAPAPGDLAVLPEMFDSGFSLNVERTADIRHETRDFIASLAREFGVLLYAGFTIRRDDGMGINRAIIAGPDGANLCVYDKLHPFSFEREPERFAPGELGVAACPWTKHENNNEPLILCPAICYDLRFPELFRAGLTLGAEVYVIGANWPRERAAHWRALLIARAIENQAYVLGVNRVGDDPHLAYAGGSLIVAPTGEVLVELDATPTVGAAEIDPALVRSWRSKFPAWRDRRPPDAYTWRDADSQP